MIYEVVGATGDLDKKRLQYTCSKNDHVEASSVPVLHSSANFMGSAAVPVTARQRVR